MIPSKQRGFSEFSRKHFHFPLLFAFQKIFKNSFYAEKHPAQYKVNTPLVPSPHFSVPLSATTCLSPKVITTLTSIITDEFFHFLAQYYFCTFYCVVMNKGNFFIFTAFIPLYKYTTIYVDGRLICIRFGSITNNSAVTFFCMFLVNVCPYFS